MKRNIILLLSIWMLALGCNAQDEATYSDVDDNDVLLYADSIWHDSIFGRKMHLQRLGGIDTLVVVKQRPLVALAKDLSINAAILAWDYYVQDRHYARISNHVLEDHFKKWPVWDGDSFSGNQFSHPYHGSLFYNAARNEGLSYGVSLLYPIIGSLTWEYFCETNPPSINDLLSTGVGGSAIGEVTHRVSDIFFDDSRVGANRVVREIIGSALNPVRAIHRLLTGETWKISPSRGKRLQPQPYSFDLGLGYRNFIEDKGNRDKMAAPYIDFEFNYGNRFNERGKSKPYDLFSIALLANLDDKHPTVGYMEIMGRLADKQLEDRKDWKYDIGFYQHVKYVDHYSKNSQDAHNFAVISEAVSFGGGLYAEKQLRHGFFSNNTIISDVVLGGSTTDYYPYRRYNFGTGFSVRNNTVISLKKRLTFLNQFYFSKLYTIKGYTPEEITFRTENGYGFNCWGDQGNHSIFTNNSSLQCNLCKNLRANITLDLYFRNSYYKYYPTVRAKSHEWKLGIIYSI